MPNNDTAQPETTPRIPDPTLDHFATIYQGSAKIRQRMSFGEFMANPELFIVASKKWPESVWVVDFVAVGVHQKMWINDQLTNNTLRCDVIRQHHPELVIDALTSAFLAHGEPQLLRINGQGINQLITKIFASEIGIRCEVKLREVA